MRNSARVLTALVAGAFLVVIVGCEADREPSQDRAILKGGKQVPENMVGWVAVPNNPPKVTENKEKGVAYAVLATHQVVPETMHSWEAMPAELFAKMTDIKLEAPKEAAPEKWVLKPVGKRIPKEMNGWVAVPFSEPKIESRAKKGLEMATLYANNIVPKDMNGWVAVDRETLAKIVEPYLTKKGSGAELPKDRK
jgi:hypothetical protein